jgi:hypothetical protein
MIQYFGIAGLIFVVATTVRWGWRLWRVNVPPTPYLYQALWASGIGLGIMSLYLTSGDPYAPWAIGVGGTLLFLSATGAQKVDGNMIEVGDTVPIFTAPGEDGEVFDSSSIAGTPLLIKFFRGHW